MFAKYIIGESYYYETANPEQDLFGRFSNGRLNKLLIDIDEASAKKTFSITDQLKNLITSEFFNYEEKGLKPIIMNNYARVVLTTNNIVSVKISEDDRRYVLFEVSNDKCGDQVYFTGFANYMNTEENQKAILEYLKGRDISRVNWIADRPKSETYEMCQYCSRCTVLSYLEHMYKEGIDENRRVSGAHLFEDYLSWCKSNNYVEKRGSKLVMMLFKRYGESTGGIIKQRIHGVQKYIFKSEGVCELLEKEGMIKI